MEIMEIMKADEKREIIILVGSWDKEAIIEKLKQTLIMLEEPKLGLVVVTFPENDRLGMLCEPINVNNPMAGPHLILLKDDSSEIYLEELVLREKLIRPLPLIITKDILSRIEPYVRPEKSLANRKLKNKRNHWPKTSSGWRKSFRGRTTRKK